MVEGRGQRLSNWISEKPYWINSCLDDYVKPLSESNGTFMTIVVPRLLQGQVSQPPLQPRQCSPAAWAREIRTNILPVPPIVPATWEGKQAAISGRGTAAGHPELYLFYSCASKCPMLILWCCHLTWAHFFFFGVDAKYEQNWHRKHGHPLAHLRQNKDFENSDRYDFDKNMGGSACLGVVVLVQLLAPSLCGWVNKNPIKSGNWMTAVTLSTLKKMARASTSFQSLATGNAGGYLISIFQKGLINN